MRFVTFQHDGRRKVGVIDPDTQRVWRIESVLGEPVRDMLDLIRRYDAAKGEMTLGSVGIPLTDVRVDAPIPRPDRNIFCVGKNYHDHAHEFTRSGFDAGSKVAADAIPEAPIFFTKPPETVIANGDPIRYPHGVSDSLDYEAELGVVIGKGGRGITKAEAYDHVFGYVIINDMTARDWQSRHKQWFLGKSFDTFCPMGPWLATADEVDAANLALRCWVNDELRQNANTRDLIFDIPTMIETLSAGITLYPGDIIATGTPAGVGIGFNPPKFLKPGDRVTIEIDGLGRLSNVLD
ncbi:2-keto-4-pentenoate hydratase/2-oxohepta-3-ene-1,7-dioic acid hydratase in catechol pathway [Azospirillum baldaniorum]|uniref:fumarylacetoacetate hydrolase family protein n=1 Tax=Azospirillum baldaniorum TaxID=1064539 RepID=UPI0011A12B35|nr:fumarylacetoacetate hydrolase family protein [Azospirillum baldaniorum]TWA61953.1 2-keto-4-pentenoate hydratase/2-oxohepta-3-ene-1,7-dioic acid hydratase in catechol pathway [Azospirillum baldaniorum]